MMAAHRVPPQMMGIMPRMLGGLGMWRKPAASLFATSYTSAEAPSGIERLAWRRSHAFEDYNLGIE